MLAPHARIRSLAENADCPVQRDYVPLWLPSFSELTPTQQISQRLRKQKKERLLNYHGPPPRTRLKTTTDYSTSVVQRPPRPEVLAKKRNIRGELFPGTDFSFIKFTPRYKPKRLPMTEARQCPFPLEPFGRFVFANGDKYEGQYATDPDKGPQRYGLGKYVKGNGSTFMGTWFADKLSGSDSCVILPTEMSKYRGEMKDGKFHGYGVYRSPDGLYQGRFKDSRLIGKSRLIDNEGYTWIGNFHCASALGLDLDMEIHHDQKSDLTKTQKAATT